MALIWSSAFSLLRFITAIWPETSLRLALSSSVWTVTWRRRVSKANNSSISSPLIARAANFSLAHSGFCRISFRSNMVCPPHIVMMRLKSQCTQKAFHLVGTKGHSAVPPKFDAYAPPSITDNGQWPCSSSLPTKALEYGWLTAFTNRCLSWSSNRRFRRVCYSFLKLPHLALINKRP